MESALESKDLEKANALYDQALKHYYKDEYQGCIDALQDAVEINPLFHQAYAKAGEILAEIDHIGQAVNAYSYAIRLDPENTEYKQEFIDISISRVFTQYNVELKKTILICLEDNDVDLQYFGGAWLSLLELDPVLKEYAGLMNEGKTPKYADFKKHFLKLFQFTPLNDPYFLYGLSRFVVPKLDFELLLTRLRRTLLHCFFEDRESFLEQNHLDLLSALGLYCLSVDFIFHETEEEEKKIDGLAQKIEDKIEKHIKGQKQDIGNDFMCCLALLSCYRPLCTLKNSDRLVDILKDHDHIKNVGTEGQFNTEDSADLVESENTDENIFTKNMQQSSYNTQNDSKADVTSFFEKLLRYQVIEPLGREIIKDRIESLTEIDEGVSSLVQEQYEEFPYPRWSNFTRLQQIDYSEKQIENDLMPEARNILNAGCGTGGEAIELSFLFPDAHVTAIDLSKSALAFGIQKAQQNNIDNINFYQADILKLAESSHKKKYDFIASSGVIHHMKDPFLGLQALVSLLNEDGILRLAVYSDLSKDGLKKAQKYIAKNGYDGSAKSIKQFRKDAQKDLDQETINAISWPRDYYLLPECRDLLFHVQEHFFTIPLLREYLEKASLEFLSFRFTYDRPEHFHDMFPDDPDGLSLENWEKYEQAYPDTFASMYRFWCKKIDSSK